MILGIGVDLVTISRVEAIMARHGERFLARVLSEHERHELPEGPTPRWVAKRFAVKEALSKAMGTGITGPVSFKNMTLGHQASGQPKIAVHGALDEAFRARGVAGVHVSISDEENLAMAFVVLEGRTP